MPALALAVGIVAAGLYLRWAVRPVVSAFRLGLAAVRLTRPASAGRGRHRAVRKERAAA